MHWPFSHSENPAKIMGTINIGPVVRNHISSNIEGRSIVVVPGLSTSSSTSSSPTSPTSSSQETVTPTEQPASTRSESMSEEVRETRHMDQQKTNTQIKNDDNEEVRGNLSHDPSEWLQEFRHVDESVPENRDASSSSHELPQDRKQKCYRVSTSFLLTSRRTETARSAWEPKLQGRRAEDAMAEPYLLQKVLVTW